MSQGKWRQSFSRRTRCPKERLEVSAGRTSWKRFGGWRLTIPSRVLGLAVQALLLGFIAQWERTPGEVTEDVVAAAFEALARGAAG